MFSTYEESLLFSKSLSLKGLSFSGLEPCIGKTWLFSIIFLEFRYIFFLLFIAFVDDTVYILAELVS